MQQTWLQHTSNADGGVLAVDFAILRRFLQRSQGMLHQSAQIRILQTVALIVEEPLSEFFSEVPQRSENSFPGMSSLPVRPKISVDSPNRLEHRDQENLRTCANSHRLILVVIAGWTIIINVWPSLIEASNKKSHSVRTSWSFLRADLLEYQVTNW